jgi:hypothetical protein
VDRLSHTQSTRWNGHYTVGDLLVPDATVVAPSVNGVVTSVAQIRVDSVDSDFESPLVVPISLPTGNYTLSELETAINSAIQDTGHFDVDKYLEAVEQIEPAEPEAAIVTASLDTSAAVHSEGDPVGHPTRLIRSIQVSRGL